MRGRSFKLVLAVGVAILFLYIVFLTFKVSYSSTQAVKVSEFERNFFIAFILLGIFIVVVMSKSVSQENPKLSEKWEKLRSDIENLIRELTKKKSEEKVDEEDEELIKRLEEVSSKLKDAENKYDRHKSYEQNGDKNASSYCFNSSRYSLLGACKELRYVANKEIVGKLGLDNTIARLYEDIKSDIGLMYGISP